MSEKSSTFDPMIDEKMYNFMRDQFAVVTENNKSLVRQVASLTDEIGIMRQSCSNDTATMKSQIENLLIQLADRDRKLAEWDKKMAEKDKTIEELKAQLDNALQKLKNSQGKRFGRTTEQRKLLNNRGQEENREAERDDFDGDGDSASTENTTSSEHQAAKKEEQPHKHSRRGYTTPCEQEPKRVDETIVHEVSDYYSLPEGGRFMMRNGEMDTYTYEIIENVPARTIRHIYKVGRVILADGETIVSTLPEEIKNKTAIDGCPFTPAMMAFILVEKFVYHSSINVVKKKLRNMGAVFSKSTLNRYYQKGMQALVDTMEEAMHNATRDTSYLMIDETCELVGVIVDEATQEKKYKKKYLWAFFDKIKNLVSYVYEHGSRGRKVVLKFLGDRFKGCISTDGYIVYKIFEDAEKHPDITHVGCWTHWRRLVVDAMASARKACCSLLDMIGELFEVEYYCKINNFTEEQRYKERQTSSKIKLDRLYVTVVNMSQDKILMSNELFAKAIKYFLNQWQSLKNFILDGKVEISNNLCEQRMKTIKLGMKNCQNIGSEDAARRQAITHSLFESCNLLKIPPLEYMTDLFSSMRSLLPNKDDTQEQRQAKAALARSYVPCDYTKKY